MRTIDHWINGALSPSTSGRSGVVYNPATGQQQAEVGLASIEEVDAAVAAGGSLYLPVHHLPDHGLSLAYVRDPEGHLIELIEPREA